VNLNEVTNLLDDHWLDPDDAHDLDLTVGVVVQAGTAAVHLVGTPTLKKNYGTHVIKLDIAPVSFPLGQHLFISASNNMFYRHSQ
jgi:hypothetical protein